MDFWNEKEGLVVGDYMDGCISILITRDGGESWKKLDCSMFNNKLPDEGFLQPAIQIFPLLEIKHGLQVEELIVEYITAMILEKVGI